MAVQRCFITFLLHKLCLHTFGSVIPMTIANLQRGSPAPLLHHLRPLTTYSAPSLVMVVSMLVASLEATSGSVMLKHDLISPLRSGSSHSRFCPSLPYRNRTSILPVCVCVCVCVCVRVRVRVWVKSISIGIIEKYEALLKV